MCAFCTILQQFINLRLFSNRHVRKYEVEKKNSFPGTYPGDSDSLVWDGAWIVSLTVPQGIPSGNSGKHWLRHFKEQKGYLVGGQKLFFLLKRKVDSAD
jgi:hypothetical protein